MKEKEVSKYFGKYYISLGYQTKGRSVKGKENLEKGSWFLITVTQPCLHLESTHLPITSIQFDCSPFCAGRDNVQEEVHLPQYKQYLSLN